MIKNIFAVIGLVAMISSAMLYSKAGPMIEIMPLVNSEKIQPMVDLITNDPEAFTAAIDNLSDDAAETAVELFAKWINAKGDIAAATTWSKKVEEDLSPEDVIEAISSVATEMNIKAVGSLPLSKELQARGIESRYLHVMSYCNPETARKMVDFSAAMSAYLPCRITLVEEDDGLWLYTLNMDMMIKMGAKMPPELLEETTRVRDTLWAMLERGAAGDF